MTQPLPPPNLLIYYDKALSSHLYNLSLRLLPRPILLSLELSGDGRFFFPLTLALLSLPSLRPVLSPLLLGLFLDLLLIGLFKCLVRRSRPVYNKDMSVVVPLDVWSFPSGHSSRAFLVAGLLSFLQVEVAKAFLEFGSADGNSVERQVRCVIQAAWIWAVFTSISRVFLGRHFVMDVVAGACLGVTQAWFVFRHLKF